MDMDMIITYKVFPWENTSFSRPPVDDWSKITPALCSPFPLFVRNKQWDIGKKTGQKELQSILYIKKEKKSNLGTLQYRFHFKDENDVCCIL